MTCFFASKSSRSCLIVSLLLAAGCGSGDGGGAGGSGGGAGGRGGTVGSGGRGGTTGAAGTSAGGTAGAAGTGGGTAGASGTTGAGGTGGATAGTTGTAGGGGTGGGAAGAGGRGGATAGTTGAAGGGGTGGGAAGSSATAGTGGGTAGGSGTTGAGGAAGGAAGTGGGTAACNALVDDSPGIPEMQVSGTPPAMTGGTIPDGTYVMSERLDYLGTCNCITHNKIVISGTSLQTITRTEPEAARAMSGTVSTSGNNITISITCPTAGTMQGQYTVLTAGGLTALRIFNTAQQQLETWTMGSCHNATNGATTVNVTRVAQAAPAATGGTIADGTYFLTSRELYTGVGGATGPTGETRRSTLVIANAASGTATVQMAQSRDGGPDQRQTFTATPSGSTLGITITCPPPGASGSFMYSASGNNLYIIDGTRVETFVRQP